MFDDIPKTDDLAAITKELAELRVAVAKLVDTMRPIAEEANFRIKEREARERQFQIQSEIQRDYYSQYNQDATTVTTRRRCDCSPTREGFLRSMRIMGII